MKITNIEKEGSDVYVVTFTPNWLEKLFGYTEKTKLYKDTYDEYAFGGGHVYVDREGNKLGNTMGYGSDIRKAIDKWRRKW